MEGSSANPLRSAESTPTGSPPAAGLSSAAAQQVWDLHGEPELRRRLAAGSWSPEMPVTSWQVLLFADGQQPIVRFEEEVLGVAVVTASRAVEAGEDVLDSEITSMSDFLLLDDDHEDAGHLTVLKIGEGQAVAFDFRYNGAHAAGLIERATEFLFTAKATLDAGYLNAFAENAYTAAELIAKAELVTNLDTSVARSKTHARVLSSYNRHGKLGNTDEDAVGVLNRLDQLRRTARYGRGKPGLTDAEAHRMVNVIESGLERARNRSPRRAAQPPENP